MRDVRSRSEEPVMNTYGMHALSMGIGAMALTIIVVNLQPFIYQALVSLTP